MTTPEPGRNALPPPRRWTKRHELLAAGTLAGLAAGIAMMAVAMIGAAGQDLPPLHPLQAIGESFVGPEALDGLAKPALGALVHAATSAALGIVLAAMAPRESRTTCAVGLGLGFSLFALGFMMSTFVPWVNPGLRQELQPMGGSWVLAQAVFGVTLGIAPALRRRFAREMSRPASGLERVRPRHAGIEAPTR